MLNFIYHFIFLIICLSTCSCGDKTEKALPKEHVTVNEIKQLESFDSTNFKNSIYVSNDRAVYLTIDESTVIFHFGLNVCSQTFPATFNNNQILVFWSVLDISCKYSLDYDNPMQPKNNDLFAELLVHDNSIIVTYKHLEFIKQVNSFKISTEIDSVFPRIFLRTH